MQTGLRWMSSLSLRMPDGATTAPMQIWCRIEQGRGRGAEGEAVEKWLHDYVYSTSQMARGGLLRVNLH